MYLNMYHAVVKRFTNLNSIPHCHQLVAYLPRPLTSYLALQSSYHLPDPSSYILENWITEQHTNFLIKPNENLFYFIY